MPLWGLALYWLLCYRFDFNIFLALSCSKLQKRCLGEKLQQVQVGLCSSGVSKENFTQKELNFPEAAMLEALPFLQHSLTGVGSLMAKMDINCHKRTLPWCYSTSSDVLLDGISLLRGYNLVQCRHWKIKQINPNLFGFFGFFVLFCLVWFCFGFVCFLFFLTSWSKGISFPDTSKCSAPTSSSVG